MGSSEALRLFASLHLIAGISCLEFLQQSQCILIAFGWLAGWLLTPSLAPSHLVVLSASFFLSLQ